MPAISTPEPSPTPTSPSGPAYERHYTPKEVAVMWNVSYKTVLRMFSEYPGVLRLSCGKCPKLRIPASALERLHEQRGRAFGRKIQGRGRPV